MIVISNQRLPFLSTESHSKTAETEPESASATATAHTHRHAHRHTTATARHYRRDNRATNGLESGFLQIYVPSVGGCVYGNMTSLDNTQSHPIGVWHEVQRRLNSVMMVLCTKQPKMHSSMTIFMSKFL